MKLNQALLFALCITFLNCSTESSGNPDEENMDSTLLKKIVYNKDTDDEYTEIFNYDGNKLTSIDYGDNTKNVYTYDDNNHLVRDDFFSEGVLEATVILDYNVNEKVATFTETFFETSGLSDRKYKHDITYNNDGTFTDVVSVSYSNAEFESHRTETITLDGGNNISKIKTEDDDFQISITYDDKNNMFKNVHAIEVLNILSENEFGALIYGNTNNMTSYTESGASFNNKETFEFVYNEKGYPISAISTSIGESDDTLEFIYE